MTYRLFDVPRTGIEPAHPCERQILSLLRLPIPPSGRFTFLLSDFTFFDKIIQSFSMGGNITHSTLSVQKTGSDIFSISCHSSKEFSSFHSQAKYICMN